VWTSQVFEWGKFLWTTGFIRDHFQRNPEVYPAWSTNSLRTGKWP
jgi:hypothetical protein